MRQHTSKVRAGRFVSNRKHNRAIVLTAATAPLLALIGNAHAATVYFDTNDTAANSGVVNNGSYSWENAVWSPDINGGASASNWVDGDTPTFTSGTDVTSAAQSTTTIFTVTANANHAINGMVIKATNGGQVYINGTGILSLNGPQTFTVNTPSFQNFRSEWPEPARRGPM